jgi:hypothetical protein
MLRNRISRAARISQQLEETRDQLIGELLVSDPERTNKSILDVMGFGVSNADVNRVRGELGMAPAK